MAAASRARSLVERENASAAHQPQPAALFEAVESTLFVEAQRNVLLCLPTKSGATLLRRLLPEFGWSLKRAPPVTIAAHASYLKVAIVREPLSRLAAAFAYKAPKVTAASRERGDLVRFLSTTRWQQLSQDPRRMDRHFQPQVLACRPDLLAYDVLSSALSGSRRTCEPCSRGWGPARGRRLGCTPSLSASRRAATTPRACRGRSRRRTPSPSAPGAPCCSSTAETWSGGGRPAREARALPPPPRTSSQLAGGGARRWSRECGKGGGIGGWVVDPKQ